VGTGIARLSVSQLGNANWADWGTANISTFMNFNRGGDGKDYIETSNTSRAFFETANWFRSFTVEWDSITHVISRVVYVWVNGDSPTVAAGHVVASGSAVTNPAQISLDFPNKKVTMGGGLTLTGLPGTAYAAQTVTVINSDLTWDPDRLWP